MLDGVKRLELPHGHDLRVWTRCPGCGDGQEFRILLDDWKLCQRGGRVQDVFPVWPPEHRERLLTGYCPECFAGRTFPRRVVRLFEKWLKVSRELGEE